MNFVFSKHALEQMEIRSIPLELVEKILECPDQKVTQGNLIVFQSIVINNGVSALVRVFVNRLKMPGMVVTVYRTSKIEKYYEGKI